ncbi:MAG TPA: WecB/TagA/CpsF family glycosyltransferase [Candidatus Elarobacter sp.]
MMPARPIAPAGSFDVFGVKLTPLTVDELVGTIRARLSASEPCIVASQNMHGISVMRRDVEFAALHALPETIVHLDGMPLVALCRLAGVRADRRHRVTLVDLIWPLLRSAEADGRRVFYLGSTPAVVAAARAAIAARHPRLTIAYRDGYFDIDDPAANGEVVRAVAAFAPHLVLVGMGMGRQERWIVRHRAQLGACTFVTVGACLEYVAGAVATPPRWMGSHGLEWLFRLAGSPTRFWRRYLVEPWPVLAYLAGSVLRRG